MKKHPHLPEYTLNFKTFSFGCLLYQDNNQQKKRAYHSEDVNGGEEKSKYHLSDKTIKPNATVNVLRV